MFPRRRWWEHGLVAIIIPVVVIIAPFVQVYLLNVTNIQLPFSDLAKPILMVTAVAAVVLWVVLSAISTAWAARLTVLLIYLAVFAFLQTNFFIGNFGFLDGVAPDWSSNGIFAWLQAGLLMVLALFCVVRSRDVLSNSTFISAVLLLGTGVFDSVALWKNPLPRDESHYVFTDDQVFDFSSKRNVIIFILDAVQADVVNELLSSDSVLKQQFPGFTFYRNTVGAFPKTYASVPAILSGRTFDNSEPLPEFILKSYLDSSLPVRLRNQDFDVRLHSAVPQSLLPNPEIADNLASTDGIAISESADLGMVINLSIFRLTPHLLKSAIYNDGSFLVNLSQQTASSDCVLAKDDRRLSQDNTAFDARFYDEFSHCAQVTLAQPVFRLFHLDGAHAPIQFDATFDYLGEQELTRASYVQQTHGALRQVAKVLEKMRDLSIYDHSTIVIVGDHGAGEYDIGLNLNQPGLPVRKLPGIDNIDQRIVRGGIPLLMVKPESATSALRVDDRPVALIDIPRTVLDDLGQPNADLPGESIFAQVVDNNRIRTHRFYEYSGWNIDYILPLNEYAVSGFSWYPESWHASGRDLNRAAELNYAGRLISFSRTGTAANFDAEGFTAELTGSRITAPSASIRPAYDASGPQLLHVIYSTMPKSSKTEAMDVYLGDQLIGQWTFVPQDGQIKKYLIIDSELNPLLSTETIFFKPAVLPSSVLIQEVGLSDMQRLAYEPGSSLDFREGGNAGAAMLQGWSLPLKAGMLSVGGRSGLVLQVDQVPPNGYVAEILVRSVEGNLWQQQQFDMLVNGRMLGRMVIDKPVEQTIRFAITSDDVQDGVIEIVFRFHTPVRPEWIGKSSDTRPLSIFLAELMLHTNKGQALTSFDPLRSCQLTSTEVLACGTIGTLNIGDGKLQGYLDYIRESAGVVHFAGWVGKLQSQVPVAIHVFSEGRELMSSPARKSRPDVALALQDPSMALSGFNFSLPLVAVNRDQLRILAVSDAGDVLELTP
ncbi:MAG: sulfatase-like hydrolase/transferase [Pseudomonadales bacterium]|nr:sulfatase-like hydrolase/transferase [Pseudomonadales bacterium]